MAAESLVAPLTAPCGVRGEVREAFDEEEEREHVEGPGQGPERRFDFVEDPPAEDPAVQRGYHQPVAGDDHREAGHPPGGSRAGGFACLLIGQLLLLEVERFPERAWRPNRALGPIAAVTLLALVLVIEVPSLGHILRMALVATLSREPVKALPLARPARA